MFPYERKGINKGSRMRGNQLVWGWGMRCERMCFFCFLVSEEINWCWRWGVRCELMFFFPFSGFRRNQLVLGGGV